MTTVEPGNIYEHYKRGDRYRVLAVASDHETHEATVVYKALYGAGTVYVRPLAMFVEDVAMASGPVPRFRFVHADRLTDFDEYQRQSRTTAVYPELGTNMVFPTLGLAGEAGEVAEKVKKVWRDRGGQPTREDRQLIAKEMGDVLWYLAQLATELRISFNEIAAKNLEKTAARKRLGNIHGEGDLR